MESDDIAMSLDYLEIGKKVLQMKTNSILTDIMISSGKVTFSAHKCILSNSSLFFKMIFADELVRTKTVVEFDQLNMDKIGVEGQVLESVVDYMYSGSIKVSNQNFAKIVKAADFLVMKDLIKLALQYLQLTIDKENCLSLYLCMRSYDLSLESSEDILERIWQMVESKFYEFIIVQEEILQVSIEDMTHLLARGIRKDFDLFNVLTFIHRWLQRRDDESAFEVAEHFLNLCLEHGDQSISEKVMNQSKDDEDTNLCVLQQLITIVNDKLGRDPNSGVIQNLFAKLNELQSNQANTACKKDECEERVSLEVMADISNLEQHDRDQSNSSSLIVNTIPSDETCNGKAAKSLTTSLEKIKVKAFEKSVQDRVSAFLEGQISYTRNRPRHSPRNMGTAPVVGGLRRSTIKRGKYTAVELVKPVLRGLKRRKMSRHFVSRGRKIKEETNDSDNDVLGDTLDVEVEDDDDDGGDDEEFGASYMHEKRLEDSFDKSDTEQIANEELDLKSRSKRKSYSKSDEELNPTKKKHANVKKRKTTHVKTELEIRNEETMNEKLVQLLKEPNKLDNQCIVCLTEFKRGSHLVRHMLRQHRDVETLTCQKCGETFNDPKLYIAHSRIHLTELEEKFIVEFINGCQTEFRCNICNKEFSKVSSVKAHLVQHKVLFGKTDKGEEVKSNETLAEKEPISNNTKSLMPKATSFTCDLCSNTFKRKDHLNRHMLCTHSDSYPFSCHVCGKKFKLKYTFNEHMSRHSEVIDNEKGEGEKSVLCYICGATMKSQKYLKRHLNTHSEMQKRFTCSVCHKSYSQSVTLQVHMRKHTGVKPFQCEICSMMFAVKSNMLRHQRRHRGEKRYKCDQCGKGFLMVGDLKRHYTTHTGEKNYSCKFCGKRFNCRSKVPQHERIHTGEKPYACRICGKRFIQSGDRKRHEATHGNFVEDKKRRLTLYEIANPLEYVDPVENVTDSSKTFTSSEQHQPEAPSTHTSHDTSGNEEKQEIKPQTYNLERAVDTIIDYALTNREVQQAMVSSQAPGTYEGDVKPSSSYQMNSSERQGKEAGPFGQSPPCMQQLSNHTMPTNMTIAPGQLSADDRMKVVVLQNPNHIQRYEQYDAPNVYYMQKE